MSQQLVLEIHIEAMRGNALNKSDLAIEDEIHTLTILHARLHAKQYCTYTFIILQ